MANHPSAEKRNRQRVRRTERNRSIKGATRTVVRKARAEIAAGTKPETTETAVLDAVRSLDRAASKGVIHPKKANRTKSRLAKAAAKRTSAS